MIWTLTNQGWVFKFCRSLMLVTWHIFYKITTLADHLANEMNQSPYYVKLNIWVQTSDWPTNWYLYQYFQPGKVGSIFLTQWRPNMKIIFWVMGCYFSASHKLCVWPISAVCYRPSMLYSKSRPLVLMIQNDQYFK